MKAEVPATERPVELSIIVVTFNAAEWVARCLESLLGEGRPRRPFEVVVVDNASNQATQGVLDRFSKQISIIRLPQNLGFGRACNIGADAARGRLLLMLNPDTQVCDGALDRLADFFDAHVDAGLVGGRTLRQDGSTDPRSCWGRPTLYSTVMQTLGLSTAFSGTKIFDPESLGWWDRSTPREVDIVTGCLLLASRDVWQHLNGFDPAFFMYGEDADLSLRARRAGYRPMITPAASVVHAVGASSSTHIEKQRLLYRGRCTVLRRHLPQWQVPVAIACVKVGVLVRLAGLSMLRRPKAEAYAHLWSERQVWSRGW